MAYESERAGERGERVNCVYLGLNVVYRCSALLFAKCLSTTFKTGYRVSIPPHPRPLSPSNNPASYLHEKNRITRMIYTLSELSKTWRA